MLSAGERCSEVPRHAIRSSMRFRSSRPANYVCFTYISYYKSTHTTRSIVDTGVTKNNRSVLNRGLDICLQASV